MDKKINQKFIYFFYLLAIFIVVNNFIGIYSHIFTRAFAFTDDPQHAHIVWNIFRGKLVYRDFFSHHSFLFHSICSVIFKALKNPASFSSLIVLRKFSFMVTCINSFILFLLAKKLFKNNFWSLACIACYSSWTVFQNSAIYIRPDLLETSFFLLALYFLFMDRKWFYDLLAGLCFAVALMFTPKALVFIIPVFLFYLFSAIFSRNSQDLKKILFVLLGFLSASIFLVIYLFYLGLISEFFYYVFIFNFKLMGYVMNAVSHIHYSAWQNIYLEKDLLLVLVLCLATLNVFKKSKEWKLLSSILLLSLLAVKIGTPPYSSMVLLPLASLLIISFVKDCSGKEEPSLRFMVILLIFFALLYPHLVKVNFKNRSEKFLNAKQDINWVLENTSRDEAISTNWNQCMAYIFNEDPQYFWLKQQYFDKIIGHDFWGETYIENLQKKKVRIISSPYFALKAQTKTNNYIKRNYELLNLRKNNNCIWKINSHNDKP